MNITIRTAVAADARDLTTIAQSAKAHWGYPQEWLQLWADDLTITPVFIASQCVLCAVSGNETVGFCALVDAEAGSGEIEHFWVAPTAMGRGIGRVLFEALIAHAKTIGITTLRIAADPNAAGFYQKMGAIRAGNIPSTPPGRTLPLFVFKIEQTKVARHKTQGTNS